MYLHKVLKDQSRWGGENAKFISAFQSQIMDCQEKSSEGGCNITEGEFCNAVLYAVQEYMERLVTKMSEEIKKEYVQVIEAKDKERENFFDKLNARVNSDNIQNIDIEGIISDHKMNVP